MSRWYGKKPEATLPVVGEEIFVTVDPHLVEDIVIPEDPPLESEEIFPDETPKNDS